LPYVARDLFADRWQVGQQVGDREARSRGHRSGPIQGSEQVGQRGVSVESPFQLFKRRH